MRGGGAGASCVYLRGPSPTDGRTGLGAGHASGFIYCGSVTGTTGARGELSKELPAFIGRVREHTDLPRAVGFGVSERAHVEAIGEMADAAVVGSAFVTMVAEAEVSSRPERVRAFVEGLTGRDSGRVPAAE